MASTARPYDLVLFGATGYTGQFAAEHVARHFPASLSWAVAGRSSQKLTACVETLRTVDPARPMPAIEVSSLNRDELHALAKKTKVIVNTVGPYSLYGEPVVEACASNGTHYLDVTGEVIWHMRMIEKHNDTAKRSGAMIIPQCGIESAPTDICAFVLATDLKENASSTVEEVIYTVHEMNMNASGGTLATVRNLFEQNSLLEIGASSQPSALCPPSVSPQPQTVPLQRRLLGLRTFPGLGTLTTSLQASADVPVVYRSWALFEKSYGSRFTLSQYVSVRNSFIGILVHVALAIAPLFLALAPVRWLIERATFKAGEGPSLEDGKKEFIEARGVGVPTTGTSKSSVRFRWQGSAYDLTAVLVCQAAATILYGDRVPARTMGAGFLTPATLGEAYVQNLEKAGVTIDRKMLDY